MGIPAKIQKFRPGSPEAAQSAVREGWKFRVDSNELFGVRVRQRLQEHGVVIEKEVLWPRGGTSLYFRDPAGNSVELLTPGVWGLPSGW